VPPRECKPDYLVEKNKNKKPAKSHESERGPLSRDCGVEAIIRGGIIRTPAAKHIRYGISFSACSLT
jgi:hypothetical protein